MTEQKRTDVDWGDLRAFLALGRRGTLSGAARALSVNHATIARRVHSLEQRLGEKLVDRRAHGYVLTPAGTRALAAASDMEAAAQSLGRRGDDDSISGLVRINAPPALAQGFLTSHLAELASRYPGLDLDLATEMRPVSLERREADIAVRLGRPSDGDVIARHVATVGYGMYGAPAACRRVLDGSELVAVGFDEANAHLPEAIWLAREFPRARLAFATSNQLAQAAAALSGIGLAVLPHYVARQVEGLELCPLGRVPPPRDLFLVVHRTSRHAPQIRLVLNHLTDVFEAQRALFA